LLLTVVPFSLSVLATLNSYLTAGAERGTATSTSTRPGTTSIDPRRQNSARNQCDSQTL